MIAFAITVALAIVGYFALLISITKGCV